jgi:hypothetical protein
MYVAIGCKTENNAVMERIECNVRDIEADDRLALERVVGQTLRDNQKLIIQINEVDVGGEVSGIDHRQPQTLADWTNVYDGLSDQQIEEIEAVILDRSHWRRNSG